MYLGPVAISRRCGTSLTC